MIGPMRAQPEPRRVAILAYPGMQSLDLNGPLEVFHGADRLLSARARQSTGAPARAYELAGVAAGGRPGQSSSGLLIPPHHSLERAPQPIDTLVVPGGSGRARAELDEALIGWIRRASASARRTVSV